MVGTRFLIVQISIKVELNWFLMLFGEKYLEYLYRLNMALRYLVLTRQFSRVQLMLPF